MYVRFSTNQRAAFSKLISAAPCGGLLNLAQPHATSKKWVDRYLYYYSAISARQFQHDNLSTMTFQTAVPRAKIAGCTWSMRSSPRTISARGQPPHRSFFIHTLGRQQGCDRKLLKSSQESSQASISNMYSIKTSAILFTCFSVFAFETVFAAQNGYIIEEVIPCLEPTASVVSETCSGSIDYKVPNISKVPIQIGKYLQLLFRVTNSIIIANATSILEKLGNQNCIKSGTKHICEAANPFRCEEEYIRIDTKNLTATCSQARKSCNSSLTATLQAVLRLLKDLSPWLYRQTENFTEIDLH